jgi:GntP family gluconate:H+ symporter
MNMADISPERQRSALLHIPDMPLVIWMVLFTLGLGLYSGMSAQGLIVAFNTGFGRALGEFALILLPSFVLAAAMSRHQTEQVRGLAALTAPIAGAGMICPDTAYAALSPIAGRQKLDVAFGSFAGFKLLFPAGPLIVATGLGLSDGLIPVYGLVLLVPVWLAGVVWVRLIGAMPPKEKGQSPHALTLRAFRPLLPFAVLAVLLIIGALADFSARPLVDFFTLPKGALILVAVLALLDCPKAERRECMDISVRRTGSLLLVIGAATAFGALLIRVFPLGELFPTGAGLAGILGLFALTAVFKLSQGSSMATFAAIAPVAAPIVASSDIAPIAAVFAICMGSFVAILPNDSFYWLVRRDALEGIDSEPRAIWILAGGAIVQALTGLALIIAAQAIGLL